MTTLPASLVLHLAALLLEARRQRLRDQIEHNPRRASASKQAGRNRMAEHLTQQIAGLRRMDAAGVVPADVAALVLAWAGSWSDAIPCLDDRYPAMTDVAGDDWVSGCKVILGAKER